MEIEVHHLTISIKSLVKSDIPTICDLLNIPQVLWTRNGLTDSIRYGFAGSTESVYLQLGAYKKIDGCSRHAEPRYQYDYPRLTLHGSFFDNSPNFDVLQFLVNLRKICTYTFKELDICHYEDVDRATISQSQWITWAESPREYFAGDMLRKSSVKLEYEGKAFTAIKFGAASSKSAYGTLYYRDGMSRLEIKYRSKLSPLIQMIMEGDPLDTSKDFRRRCIDALCRQLEITTRGTAHTRQQKRNPAYTKYLGSQSNKLNLAKIAAIQTARRTKGDTTRFASAAKRVAGYLNNYVARHATAEALLEHLTDGALEALRAALSLADEEALLLS